MKKSLSVYLQIFILTLFFIAQSCKESTPDDKREFFRQADIFANDTKLKEKIKKLQITDREVSEYARKINDVMMRAKLIAAVYSDYDFNDKPAKEEFWAAIRYNLVNFVQVVATVREDTHKTFMDIGSGNGEKLFAAYCLGFDKAYGLEYSKESFEASQKNLANFKDVIEIVQADALKIDKSFFQKADFLYLYSPIKDNELMATLFKRAMDNMKEGAVLLEVRMVYVNELRKVSKLKFPLIKSWVAVKKKEGKFYYKNILDNRYSYNNKDSKDWTLLEPYESN
ncbi:MAG: class I SAM-dependent methyltransferase [Cytophagales bacterium]|nr:MAG: class I SAM-dependent methyltransferase [Cytophagales bacterium]